MSMLIQVILLVVALLSAGIYFLVARRKQSDLQILVGSVASFLLVWLVPNVMISFYVTNYTDALWFESVGYSQVFWVQFWTELIFYWITIAIVFVVMQITSFVSLRAYGQTLAGVYQGLLSIVNFVVAHLGAVLVSNALTDDWLALQNGVAFGRLDPVHGFDVAFYVFSLPFYQTLVFYLSLLFWVVVVYSVGLSLLVTLINKSRLTRSSINRGIAHSLVLFGLFWMVESMATLLRRYELVVDGSSGVISGASWIDLNIQIPFASWLWLVMLVFAVITFGLVLFRKNWWFVGGGVTMMLLFWTFFGALVPAVYTSWRVKPNESIFEVPYIESQIANTLYGFNLETVETQTFPYQPELSPEEYQLNDDTLRNTRIQDWVALDRYNEQLQTVRPFYQFNDVDFIQDPQYGVLMGSVRELEMSRIPNRTWVNNHLVYTHGYGYVMARTNAFSDQQGSGSPAFIASGFPVSGAFADAYPTTREQIYFGESMTWAVVNTQEREIDYPQNEGATYTQYTESGISMTGWNRLMFAIRFDDMQIWASSLISPESQLLWRRNLRERLGLIAPYILWDDDPYFVIGDDQIYWVASGFSVTNRLPYSQSRGINSGGSANYIRRNVIAVIGAYDGQVRLYQLGDDPLLSTWAENVYGDESGTMLLSAEEMPEFVRTQIRYPEDLFNAQSAILARYHITNPSGWYQNDDGWAVPEEQYSTTGFQPMDARFIWARLPGESENEMLLVRPYVPRGERQNMVAWLAATMDNDLILWEFPRDLSIPGPEIVQSQVNTDDAISPYVTLRDSNGSEVFWGNTIVTPILSADGSSGTIVYAEPLFLVSDNGLPEIQRIILWVGGLDTGGNLIIARNLDDALDQLYSGSYTTVTESLTSGPDAVELSGEAIEQIEFYYAQAESCLQQSDMVCFGENWEAIGGVLATEGQ